MSSDNTWQPLHADHINGGRTINSQDDHKDTSKKWFCTLCSRMSLTDFFQELRQLLKLSVPLWFQQLSMNTMGPVAVMFCGYLGTAEVAAVSLASSILNVFCISIAVGLASAADTLFPQVYGTSNKLDLGVVVQRSLIAIGLAGIPCTAININAEAICIALGQDPLVSRMAADYTLVLLPGTISFFFYITLLKYIHSQNIVLPTLLIGTVANGANAGLHWLLLRVVGLGILGSAISQSISLFLLLGLSLCFILGTGVYKRTWKQWDKACFRNWGQFMYLAMFGVMLTCTERWTFEAGTFLAGRLGKHELAVQTIVLQVAIFAIMFPMGTGIAASIRVGQALGAADARAASVTAWVAIVFKAVNGIIVGILIGTLKDHIPLLFSNDIQILEEASAILSILAVYVIFYYVATVCFGILTGIGRQRVGAAIVSGSHTVALVMGVPIIFLTTVGIEGFWIGLTVAACCASIISLLYIYHYVDWENEVLLAKARISISIINGTEVGEKTTLLSPRNNWIQAISEDPLCHKEDNNHHREPSMMTVRWRRLVVLLVLLVILVLGVVIRLCGVGLDDSVNNSGINITNINTTVGYSSTSIYNIVP